MVMTLCMTGLGECDSGSFHPIWYACGMLASGKGPSGVVFDIYDRIFLLLRAARNRHSEPLRSSRSIAELARGDVLGLISWSLFVVGGVTYPPRDEIFMSL